jgi:putative NADH-flavin reductase
MKVALVGATGNAGSRILAELSRRGHEVTAIVRNPEKVPAQANVTARKGDVSDKARLSELLAGHDVAVSAVRFAQSDPHKLIGAARSSGVKRYLVVGGAASLEAAPGVRLLDTSDFPSAYKAEASAGAAFLDLLRQERELDWTFISPSAMFVPGERTGRFRLGQDQLLTSEKGSSISFEDYAIALVDEVEKPSHSRKRFTVGY